MNFKTIENSTDNAMIKEVYVLHDNVYFTRENAEHYQDGKDYISVEYIMIEPNEKVEEGEQTDEYVIYENKEDAMDAIEEWMEENR